MVAAVLVEQEVDLRRFFGFDLCKKRDDTESSSLSPTGDPVRSPQSNRANRQRQRDVRIMPGLVNVVCGENKC